MTATFSEADNLARIIAWQQEAADRSVVLYRASFEWHPDGRITYLGEDVDQYIEAHASNPDLEG